MQITTATLLATMIAGPMAVLADSCKRAPSCRYWDEVAWTNAAEKFCDPADNYVMKKGEKYTAKTSKNDDGAGGAQIFSGTVQLNRNKEYTIHDQECASYMSRIFANCKGYGGSIDTGFGTVSAECIVDKTVPKTVAADENDILDGKGRAKAHLLHSGRNRRDQAANRAKKMQDKQNRADLKQHKADEKSKQEEEAKIHEDHQKVAAEEDQKAAGGEKMSRRAAKKAKTNAKPGSKVDEENRIHAEHAKVAAEEDRKAAANLKLAQQAPQANKRADSKSEDLKNAKKTSDDQKDEDDKKQAADEKAKEDKAAENAKIQAEQDKVAADEKAKEDQKAKERKKEMDDKAAEDAKIKSQTVQ